MFLLALYHVGLFLASSVSWVSFANLSTIDYLVHSSRAFEIAYTTVYFVQSLVAFLFAFSTLVFTHPLMEIRPPVLYWDVIY